MDCPPRAVAEYFAGIGLVRMGLARAGWQVVFANDIAPKKFAMYQTFFPASAGHYHVGDIFDLDPSTLPPALLATCSFPCIDLSLAGNMRGMRGENSSAFWGFIDILRAQGTAAPPLVLVENVPGWLHSHQGTDFRLTLQALNEAGYACDVFALDALHFLPQSRLRIFVVGTKLPPAPPPDSLWERHPVALFPTPLRRQVAANPDLNWFQLELPAPPPKRTGGLAALLEDLALNDPRWWSPAEVERHLNMMSADHRLMVQGLIEGEPVAYRTFYRRRRQAGQRAEVRRDDIAGCLRTAVGGSGKQFVIRAGQGQVAMRVLTPREYARLQGVPDAYPIEANGVQALTGFGDAVCVPVIEWIARHALAPLAAHIESPAPLTEGIPHES